MSKRQTVTACSSAESEIYAMDECTKALQHICNTLKDLGVFDDYTDGPIPLKNDNAAAVQWSYNMTTKGLRSTIHPNARKRCQRTNRTWFHRSRTPKWCNKSIRPLHQRRQSLLPHGRRSSIKTSTYTFSIFFKLFTKFIG